MATPPTPEQLKAIKALADAIIEAVRAADPTIGAPGGVIYAALLGKLSLERYESFMSALVRTGKLTKRGECYFIAVDKRLEANAAELRRGGTPWVPQS
jgi:hypothetical protein